MAINIEVIWVFGKPEYFFKRGWTRIAGESPSGKSVRRVLAARRAGRRETQDYGCISVPFPDRFNELF
jgi:hypothetical protein